MKISEIFKDSFNYPSTNWNNLLILGVLVIIANIVTIIPAFGIELSSIGLTGILLTIVSIISLIINLIIAGYSFSIIQKTIRNVAILPEIEFGENLVNGIKVLLITIVYYLIPLIVTLIVAYVTGAFNSLMEVIALNGATISNALATNLVISFFTVAIIALILFIIFTLIATIAIARFADKGNMGAAFEVGEIFDTIGKIGWGNYIVWYILLILILIIIEFIMGLINLIPVIGIIISLLFFSPYITIFASRATGLIYNEKN